MDSRNNMGDFNDSIVRSSPHPVDLVTKVRRVSDILRVSKVFESYEGLVRATKSYQEPPRATWGYQELQGATKSYQELHGATKSD